MNQAFYDYPPVPKVNPNSNIRDLNAVISSKLIANLDLNDHKTNWRALINAVPDAPFSQLDVEVFANKKLENKSPSKSLLVALGNHGRTVQQLISYLKSIENEPALFLLQTMSEDIYIIQHPVNVAIDQGEDSTAVFSCHGKGFPFPRYQWYKGSLKLPYGNHRVLKINPVSLQDAGNYCCRLHNEREGNVVSYIFTMWVELKVQMAQEFIMPTLEVTKHPSSVTAQVGNEIILECDVTCQFTPRYQWYRMEKSGAPASIQGKTDKKLVFRQANMSDSGHYKCKIESGREKAWTYIAKVDIVPNSRFNPEPRVPVIVRQPISMDHVNDNETVVLACEACGVGPLYYQWYKDGDVIPDATGPEYRIEAMKPNFYGAYMCVVKNRNGEVQSTEALIQLPIILNPICALNKVALLIGNQTYRGLDSLNTPIHEVVDLAKTLYCDCNFKVISLIDLTKDEIVFAVQFFCQLLAKGMYGLFFFSGHGFENDGHSFLIPVDSTSEHKIKDCVDTQWVLDQMQNHETALNVMLLDICRNRNDYEDQKVDEKIRPRVLGNTVFGYAAAANAKAYEAPDEKHSVFSKHLLQNIKKRQRIEHVLENVKKGVQADKTSKGQQFPQVISDLVTDRGLCDPINSHNCTKLFNVKMKLWEEAHEIEFEPYNFHLFYNFYVCYDVEVKTSNIMTILVYISNDYNQRFNIQLQNFSPELNVKVTKEYEPKFNIMVLKTTVSGLQKLKRQLQPTIYIKYTEDGTQPRRWTAALDFGTPLVSKIWQRYNYKQPMESAYPDYDLPEHQGRGITLSNLKEISENIHADTISPSPVEHGEVGVQAEPTQNGSESISVHSEESLTKVTSDVPPTQLEIKL